MELYELIPLNGRKSFYGKAQVSINKDSSITLYSYGTPIVIKKGNKLKRIFTGEISCTTSSHIISFCGLHKNEFEKLKEGKYESFKK